MTLSLEDIESTGGGYWSWLVRATLEDVTLESGSLEDGES